MTNGKNYRYYNNFKVDVVGGFYAIDDVNIFKKYLKKISKKHIPFLVVCSGKSGKEIIPICKQYFFVKEVIIFCMNDRFYLNSDMIHFLLWKKIFPFSIILINIFAQSHGIVMILIH
jgi:hypothetical protein